MEMIKELHIIDDQTSGNIFTSEERQYIIPLYQREYAWGEKQIVRLIEDISDAEKDKKYYIGTLIVSERNDKKLEVIDGQQRLTTLFLLLNCLGVTTKTHLTFECRDRSNYTLKNIQKAVKGKNNLDEKQQEDNIVKGVEIIKRTLEKEEKSNPRFIDALKEKLKKVILFQIIVPEHTDLNRYFEIMNTRGEQLAQHDILKAHLMKDLTPDERASFARIWDACSDMDGYVQMHFSPKRREKLFGDDWNKMPEEDNIWPQHNSHSTQQSGNTQEAKNNWTIVEILKQKEVQTSTEIESKEERTRFESIIDFPHFLLHTLKVYLSKNGIKNGDFIIGKQLDDKKLTDNFGAVEKYLREENHYQSGAFARKFIVCLLQTRFTFDQYIIKREYTSKNEAEDGEWSLKTLYASKRQKGNNKTTYYKNSTFIGKGSRNQESVNKDLCKENLMIQSALRVSYTSPKDMHWITELLKDLYVVKRDNIFTDEYPKSIAKDMGDEILTFTENIAAKAVNSFIDNNKKDDKWKESGTATPHILFNYLDYLLWKKELQKFNDFIFEFRNSVEHWFPQHPSDGTIKPWDDDSWGITAEQKSTVDRLGNLCLVQRNVNSRFTNNSPASKKTMWEDSTIKKGSLKLRLMSEKTTGDKEWRTTACEEHEKAMIDILEKDLKIKFPSQPPINN